jgi:hypothetical protein
MMQFPNKQENPMFFEHKSCLQINKIDEKCPINDQQDQEVQNEQQIKFIIEAQRPLCGRFCPDCADRRGLLSLPAVSSWLEPRSASKCSTGA